MFGFSQRIPSLYSLSPIPLCIVTHPTTNIQVISANCQRMHPIHRHQSNFARQPTHTFPSHNHTHTYHISPYPPTLVQSLTPSHSSTLPHTLPSPLSPTNSPLLSSVLTHRQQRGSTELRWWHQQCQVLPCAASEPYISQSLPCVLQSVSCWSLYNRQAEEGSGGTRPLRASLKLLSFTQKTTKCIRL